MKVNLGVVIEVFGAVSTVVGVSLIYRPAAFILAGAIAIFAIERQPDSKP